MGSNYRWRLAVYVTKADKLGILELARQRQTSPAVVMQSALRKLLLDATTALPLVSPTVPLDDQSLVVNVTHSDYSGLMELARKAITSPSALVHLAICKALQNPDALPDLIPAADMPEGGPCLIFEGGDWRYGIDYGPD